MSRQKIETVQAPKAIGTYSQAMKSGNTVYLSGQIGLDPETMQMVQGIEAEIHQVFKNLTVICAASGGSTGEVVKLTIYLTNLDHFPLVNEIMPSYFPTPYPARAVVGVSALPRGANVEADAILVHSPNVEAVLPSA